MRLALIALPALALVVVFVVISQAASSDRPALMAAAAIALAAGISAASVGVYGAVLVPGILLLGVDPRAAVAMSLLLQILVIPIGASSHLAVGNVRAEVVRPLLAGGVIGAVLGAMLATSVSGEMVGRSIALLIVLLGIAILVSLRIGRLRMARSAPVRARRIGGIGLVAGFASGISGAGWGPLGIKMLLLSGVEPRAAIGSSLVGRIFIAIAAVVTYQVVGGSGVASIQPATFLCLLAASVAGMVPGAIALSRLGAYRASALVALISIALALPTLVGLRL